MKKILFPFAIAIGLTAFVLSCKPDDEPEPDQETSVAQDKANIKASFDQVVNCATAFKNGDMVTTIKAMFGIDEGNSDEEWAEIKFDSLTNVFDFDHIDDNSTFDLAHHAGTYTYNHSTEGWDFVNTPTNQVILIFPSDSTKTSNDMEFAITTFSTQSHPIDGAMEELPTNGSYSIKKDGSVIHSFTINSISYEDLTDWTIPTDLDVTIVTAPYTFNITGRKIDALNFEAEIDINNQNGCGFNLKGDIEFSSSDYENLTDDDLVEANATLIVNGVKATTTVDLATLLAINDPTENQYNAMIDNDVYFNDIKIADLELRNVSDSTDTELHLVYKDASTEDIDAVYITPFIEDLEVALFDLLGNID